MRALPPERGARAEGAARTGSGEALELAVERAAAIVATAGEGGVVALTGAGISTDAGIPDFRGPDGVWTRNPEAERLSTLSYYLADEEVRRRAWQVRLNSPVWSARPTPGHDALVVLERRGYLSAVVTQNTDGLHLLAGHEPDRVVEVHGTGHWCECWSCGDRRPMREVLERVSAGESDPRCTRVLEAEASGGAAGTAGGTAGAAGAGAAAAGAAAGAAGAAGAGACGGVLKSATVSFGQSLDPGVLDRAVRAAASARVMLAVGTTLEVQPAAGLVPLARGRGARVVIVNGSATALDSLADVVVRGSISEVLPRLVPPAGPASAG